MSSESSASSSSASRLEQFRTKAPRQRIHETEKILLYVLAAQLVFLPWAIGGMRVWSQWISLGLSVTALAISLWPREYREVGPGQAPFRLYTWPKLVRFPIFWLGLGLLGYIVVQALNPAWVYETNGTSWWMKAHPHNAALPSGVEVPFTRWGPWRMLIIYASVLMTVCAVWIGLTRRRSLQMLFTALAANAFLLAILGIAQRATDTDKMFWLWKPPAAYFVSSFVYKNHAGAYFNLLLALCAGLALWHYERGLRRLDKSSPSGVFAFFGTSVVLIVIFSYSRTATILMFAFLFVAAAIFFRRQRVLADADSRSPLATLLVMFALVAFLYLGTKSLSTEQFISKMAELQEQLESDGPGSRTLAAKATWSMFQDKFVFGWGSGSFQFCFPTYQRQFPEISFSSNHRTLFWEHAHNDYLELLAEFGIVGGTLIFLMVVYWSIKAIRVGIWRNAVGLFGAIGCGVVAIHSVVDFHAYNPAILTTFCVLAVSLVRWSEIEEVNPAG